MLMREVFGLTDPMPVMSPVHIPRGFTKAYINGDVVEDLGARVRTAHADLARGLKSKPDRGHRPRRCRRGHRPVERGRGGDARCAGRSSSARAVSGGRSTRSSSTPRISRRHGVEVAGAIVNKVYLDEQPGLVQILERGLPSMTSRCSASCPTGRSCRTPPWRWSSRASTARRSTLVRISTGSSRGSPSAPCSRPTCSSASARERWSSSRAIATT